MIANMSLIRRRVTRLLSAGTLVLLAGGALLTASAPASAQQIAAFVNGEPITALDVEKRARIIEAFNRRKPTRKEALDELIEQKVKLAQARKLDINITDTTVDRTFAAMARGSGRTPTELEGMMRQSGIDVRAFKSKLRADLSWRDVMQKMAPGSFQVRDADIVAALTAKGETASAKAMQYTMRQVIFVVRRDADANTRAARTKQAESLRAKFSDCERDLALAREYSEVVIKEPVIRISTDLPEKLQQLLEKTPDGQMTPPEPTNAGIEVVAICGRKETVADLSSRRGIREELLSQRVETQEKKILDNLLRQAIIDIRDNR
jgi:peptidyl-prolyl cis-trans isomerase SurA